MQMRCPWEATQKPLPVAFLCKLGWGWRIFVLDQGQVAQVPQRIPSSAIRQICSGSLLSLKRQEGLQQQFLGGNQQTSKLEWHFEWARGLLVSMFFLPHKTFEGNAAGRIIGNRSNSLNSLLLI
jgi:hypothetical protein